MCVFGADAMEDAVQLGEKCHWQDFSLAPELRRHLEASTVVIPSTWQQLDVQARNVRWT